MKKLLLALLMVPAIGTVAQTKKVVLEDYTGTWCGWCPEGTVVIEGLEVTHPANLLPIANHNGDALQIPEGAAVDAALDVTSYPGGSIDRFKFPSETKVSVNRGKWSGYVNTRLSNTAIVSVGFANHKINGTDYEMDLNVKFTSAPTAGVPVVVQVYVLEDSIPAVGTLAQKNQVGTNPQSSVQPGVTPLQNWFHNHTLRSALGGNWGYTDIVPATVEVGKNYTKKVSFTIPSTWVKKHVHLYAFVAYNGATADKKEIINAEEISLKAFFPSNVNEVKNTVSFMNSYPNPARTSDVIKLEYNINESTDVTLKVYNAIGQLVATPYNSNEVVGTHTIHWRPADNGVAPGLYILELSTPHGKTTQRLSIQ